MTFWTTTRLPRLFVCPGLAHRAGAERFAAGHQACPQPSRRRSECRPHPCRQPCRGRGSRGDGRVAHPCSTSTDELESGRPWSFRSRWRRMVLAELALPSRPLKGLYAELYSFQALHYQGRVRRYPIRPSVSCRASAGHTSPRPGRMSRIAAKPRIKADPWPPGRLGVRAFSTSSRA